MSAPIYMLDTNIFSQVVREHPAVCAKVAAVPIHTLAISAMTAAEVWYGLEKARTNQPLRDAVVELLRSIDVLPWGADQATTYGALRAQQERHGKRLADMDLLIAAHALSLGATLVTNDAAFGQVKGLKVVDWTQ
jgi:tRNA(fMet)-specific endonuclease VapC